MKRRRLLSFAMAMVMCISTCMPGLTAYAADPGETPLTELECTCEDKCTEDDTNSDCVICAGNFNLCNGKEKQDPAAVQPKSAAEVWIDGKNGDDRKSGASIDEPVRTIQKAMELAGEGGTIIVKDTVTIEDENNLVLENVTIKRMDDDATGAWDEILIKNSSVTLKNITLDGNKDGQPAENEKDGYLLNITNSNVTIEEGTVICNYAGYAAMKLYKANVTMNGGEFTGNEAHPNGSSSYGTVCITGSSTFVMNDGYIHDNTSYSEGAGAFYICYDNSAKLNIHGGVITKNNGKRGAIYNWGGVLRIDGGSITDNKGNQAGAIGMYDSAKTTIFGTEESPVIITNNYSSSVAGAISVTNATLDIIGNVEITNNGTQTGGGAGAGGGLYISSGNVSIGEGVILCNNRSASGPDICFHKGTLTLPDAAEMNQEYRDSGYDIDGWYRDDWMATVQNTLVNPGTLTATGFGKTYYELVAAYTAHRVIYHNYQSGTPGTEIPASGLPALPNDTKAYLPGDTAPLKQPSKTRFVGPKNSDPDAPMGVWTFEGWKYNSWNGIYGTGSEYTVENYVDGSVTMDAPYLVKRPDTIWYQDGTGVMLTGIWEWSQEDVPWYYEVYYQADGTNWTKLTEEPVQGGTAAPAEEVSITSETIQDLYKNSIMQQDILTSDPEQLGTHYVFDENYPNNYSQKQRLSAQAGDASKENPLKIYFKAAEHRITYEYEGDVPEEATDQLPAQETARYRQTVNLDEPELIGYTFSGWSVKEPNGAQKLLEDGELTMPNTDVTLVGSWTERDPAVISPADMTVYMGGEAGYDGILDANGNVIPSDSLPEPFFKITLPSDVDENVNIQMAYLVVENENAQYYGTWFFIPCGEGTDLYRLVLPDEELPKLPVQFTKDGEKCTDDSFLPVSELSQTLTMEVVLNELETADEAMLIYMGTDSNGDEIDGQCKFEFIKNDNGLIVRGTTENPQYAKINAKSITEGTISAATPEGTTYTYYVDGQDIPVWDDALEDDFGMTNDMDIALLVDDIINSSGTDRETALKDKAEKYFEQQGIAADYSYQFKHLDLVDRNNGNALVAASEPVTVSWPIPEGVELTDEINFKVLHFKGLNREDSDLSHCTIEEITPTVENGYATFSIAPKTEDGGGFSPFALAWGKKEPTPATYKLTYHANDATNRTSVTSHTSGAEAVVATSLWNRTDYVFTSWNTAADGSGTSYTSGASITMTSSIDLYAQWRYTGGTVDPDPDPTEHTLRYETNSSEMVQSETKKVSWTKKYGDLPTPQRDGYTFAGWYRNSTLTMPITGDVKVYGTVTIYAKWNKTVVDPDDTGVSDLLNTQDHKEYLHGYDTGLFGPNNDMTRAEAAQMFYNLLLDKDVPVTVNFSDVPTDTWYATAVNTLASLGLVEGIGNNLFAPERPITRAEFTVIAMRFTNGDVSGENIFSDVSADDWFYDQVVGSIQYGWITGYADGTFRPNTTIARAEVTTIVNRMLGRSADEDYVDRHEDDLRLFPDVSQDYWAYYQIAEATNAHDYTKKDNAESWIKLK